MQIHNQKLVVLQDYTKPKLTVLASLFPSCVPYIPPQTACWIFVCIPFWVSFQFLLRSLRSTHTMPVQEPKSFFFFSRWELFLFSFPFHWNHSIHGTSPLNCNSAHKRGEGKMRHLCGAGHNRQCLRVLSLWNSQFLKTEGQSLMRHKAVIEKVTASPSGMNQVVVTEVLSWVESQSDLRAAIHSIWHLMAQSQKHN